MTDVYIILIRTRQGDERIGAVYDNKAEAVAECERLMRAQGKLEVNEAFILHREMHHQCSGSRATRYL